MGKMCQICAPILNSAWISPRWHPMWCACAFPRPPRRGILPGQWCSDRVLLRENMHTTPAVHISMLTACTLHCHFKISQLGLCYANVKIGKKKSQQHHGGGLFERQSSQCRPHWVLSHLYRKCFTFPSCSSKCSNCNGANRPPPRWGSALCNLHTS